MKTRKDEGEGEEEIPLYKCKVQSLFPGTDCCPGKVI